MNFDYKYDIFKNIVEIVGIFYIAFGLLTSYCWSCQQLDTKSYDPGNWESVASIMCMANFANIFIIIVQLWISRNITPESQKSTTNQLFYLLSVPLFFGTLIYKISETIDEINKHKNDLFSLLMIMFEFLLCCGVMIQIINVNFVKSDEIPFHQSQFRNIVLYISTIGMSNYFLYHFVILHLNTFIEIAGNITSYRKYYKVSFEKIKNNGFRNKLEPVVILFYFVCISYLIFLIANNEINERKRYSGNPSIISTNRSKGNRDFSFRIPPISILFAVMCITVTLLAIIVVAGMSPLDKNKCLIYVIFPVPIYLFSIFLLILQINEMQKWKKLENRNFSIDRIFIRIGVLGQILVAFSELKYNIHEINKQSTWVLLQYISLIIQISIQTLTCGLALNRRWIPIDNFKGFWSSICPPVGLLSMNIAFLMFSVFIAYNKFCNFKNHTMSLELMRSEVLSFGETLSILHRLHGSLIFGKIAYLTYCQ